MQIGQDRIRLAPMTNEMYRSFFLEYENDPDLCLPGQEYDRYEYSEERVKEYIRRQHNLKRIPLAILLDDEIVGEIIIRDIEPYKSAAMGIVLKNARYKDHGIGTQAEKLAFNMCLMIWTYLLCLRKPSIRMCAVSTCWKKPVSG